MLSFRPNVAFILKNADGQILIGERRDRDGCWQFPQGGREEGESLRESLHREVKEELGLEPDAYRIVSEKGPYRYIFSPGRKKEGFDGQEQHYVLADFLEPHAPINLEDACEFQKVRWIEPASFQLDWIGPMKRQVYIRVFQDFFGLSLADSGSGNFC